MPTVVGIVGLLIALIFAIAGIWGAYTVFWALPSQYFGGTAAAEGIALINTVGILGRFVAPTIMGSTKQLTGSTHSSLLTMVALLVVSVIGFATIPRTLAESARNRGEA